jgi:S-adenosylmethionine:tRNA ribosyltransferase-isomerase
LKLVEKDASGEWTVKLPEGSAGGIDLLQYYGEVPLPHYIERETPTSEDLERYQTVYAEHPGAVAAPTAGLHFTPELISRCAARGVDIARVTLHVGIGTFRPINVPSLDDHRMHAEWCRMSQETAEKLRAVRQRGGRVAAVGTTSTRTLESIAAEGGLREWEGETRLFIRPPFDFKVVDMLLTNFHLPRSTLLVLLSTFAGRNLVLQAYAEAVRERYRFFSYGDAMLVL